MKGHRSCQQGHLKIPRNVTKWGNCRLCLRQRHALLHAPMQFEQLLLFELPEECKERKAA